MQVGFYTNNGTLPQYDANDDAVVYRHWRLIAEYNMQQREAEQWLPEDMRSTWVRTGQLNPALYLAREWVNAGQARSTAFSGVDWRKFA